MATTELGEHRDHGSYPAVQAPEEADPSPVAAAHGMLRGRYRWAIGLGVVFAIAGGLSGYCFTRLTYRSSGMIEVAPVVPRILYKTETNGLLEMFGSFVDSQVQLLQSRRVIDMSMQSPEWSALKHGMNDREVARFQKSLEITRPSGSQFITVSFTDEDHDVATVAVNQVIKAYMKLVDERESQSGLSTIRTLESQRTALNSKLRLLEQDTLSVSEGLGADGFDERCAFERQEMNKFDVQLNSIDLEIAKLDDSRSAADGTQDAVLTEQQIALKDPLMASLLEQKSEMEGRVTALTADGLGPKHPDMIAATNALTAVTRRIAVRALLCRSAGPANPTTPAAERAEKRAYRTRVIALRDAARAESKRLGEKRTGLLQIAQDKRLCTEQLEDVKRRLDELTIESEVHGRISVMSYGERPLGPDGDKRTSLAALGGMGGLALGFGLVLAWGLRDARVRYIVDINQRSEKARFLGILPDVVEGATDAAGRDACELAEYCVHHVRTMLQLRSAGDGRVVAVTSPSPGDGKTMLGLSLGMSYGATGARVLLVDCDFVGHGLTSATRSVVCALASRTLERAAATDSGGDADADGRAGDVAVFRRIAELLAARRMRFDDAQVAELLAAVRASIGPERPMFARIARALEAVERQAPGAGGTSRSRGVLGALSGVPVEDCVIEAGMPNVSVLPVGDAIAGDAESLSPETLERLFAKCRDLYDIVIIDTGPVLGSLEAVLSASVADCVVMIVSRGSRQQLVPEAIERLERVGADVAGVVFNRALAADVAKSSYASRSASVADVSI